MNRFAEVVVASGTRMTDQLFTYRIPTEMRSQLRVGTRVLVPFGRGNRTVPALVLALKEESELPEKSLKSLLAGTEDPLVATEEGIAMARYMIRENLSDFSSAFASVLPPGGIGTYRPKWMEYVRLREEGQRAKPAAHAKRQQAVLAYLRTQGEISREALQQATGADGATLRRMEQKGWIALRRQRIRRTGTQTVPAYEKLTFSKAQQAVYDAIAAKPGAYLLCGVTGSGKTEIYLQLAEQALAQGKQAIILVPEISLTPQTIARFQGRFGDRIAVLHSRLSVAERYEEWERIFHGEASIAIGARSAIFAPFQKLGLIVIDEEHEDSYYSEKNPKYHAHEIAQFRREYHQCTLVLGSATPSVDTLYAVEQGSLQRLDLKCRVAGRSMPRTTVVDMREELKANNRSMFSRGLQEAMARALARGEQILLFLNKRGHTSYVFCRKCGYVYRCDACDVSLTYHKHRNQLICHYCGRQKPYQKTCPQCGSQAVREFGAGTEQLEEETRRLFPQAVVQRADADTMAGKEAYHQLYEQMLRGSVDVLIGTQMISKGFDFPNVTVVGIVAADVTLHLPDFRAAERAFQLLTQVSGRAGRADKGGEVYIQTYKPDHYAIRHAVTGDVDGFYREEIQRRRENGYPPTMGELHIGISGADRSACWTRCQQIAEGLRRMAEQLPAGRSFTWAGPTPSVIERIDRRYRFGILLRSADEPLLRDVGAYVLEKIPSTRSVQVVVTRHPRSVY